MLFLYDFEFNLLGFEGKVISSSWKIHFNDIGTFEAHLAITSPFAELVMENQYLVAVQKDFSAIIVGYELRDELILYGRTCNWLLTKRVTDKISQNAALGTMATEIAAGTFSDVPEFVIGNTVEGDEAMFECPEETVFDAIKDCLSISKLGHSLNFDVKNKRWVFNILESRDTKIIFSEGHKNAYDMRLSADILDLATCGRYTEETDDGYKTSVIEGDKEGIYRWEALLSGMTQTEAQVCLDKLKEKREALTCVKNVSFNKDYLLGDIVRLKITKGGCRTTLKRQITGIELTLKQGVYTQQPIFE